jgi:hypothetical protein
MLRTEALLAGVLITALTAAGCATSPAPRDAERRFDFERDSLAFSNKLYWRYDFSQPGAVAVAPETGTPPEGGHRCASMARAVRQFFDAASFDPGAPRVSDAEYRERVREVLETNPRQAGPRSARIVIPGYSGLRSFSREHEAIIDPELGGAAASYLQRGNWRMIFPFAPRQNRAGVEGWVEDLARGRLPVLRVVNFPTIDVNHTLVLFAAEPSPLEVRFFAYDPNEASTPLSFVFRRADASFHYPRTSYARGGTVQVYEVYDGFFF